MASSFKDVEYTKVDLDSPGTDVLADVPDDPDDAEEVEDAEDSRPLEESAANEKPSRLSLAFYRQFFDVDSRQVGLRLLGSFVPRPGRSLVTADIRHSPDLYGPFWVSATLVFASAVSGNLVSYLQAAASGGQYDWVYDFSKVTLSATGIYIYWWLAPFLLWLFMWWRQVPEKYSYLELLCLFGYSLTAYVPAFVLCAIPFSSVRWPLVLLAMLLSGAALATSLWPALGSGGRRQGAAATAGVVALHAALAVWFKLYFFPDGTSAAGTTPQANVTAAAAAS